MNLSGVCQIWFKIVPRTTGKPLYLVMLHWHLKAGELPPSPSDTGGTIHGVMGGRLWDEMTYQVGILLLRETRPDWCSWKLKGFVLPFFFGGGPGSVIRFIYGTIAERLMYQKRSWSWITHMKNPKYPFELYRLDWKSKVPLPESWIFLERFNRFFPLRFTGWNPTFCREAFTSKHARGDEDYCYRRAVPVVEMKTFQIRNPPKDGDIIAPSRSILKGIPYYFA